ncbi:MAG: FtsW/RodA/SpoVE family cell cycle protein [Patescibacteria group bacterium]
MTELINHLKRLDWVLLSAIGLVFIMGLATFYATPLDHSLFYRQLIFGFLGFALILGLSFFDWRILRENSGVLVAAYVAGLAALFILFAVGREVRGVTSWFKFGAFNFEPVEIVKIILTAVLAKYFSARHIELYRAKNIIISGLYAAVPAALVLIQPDLGSAIILLAVWFGLVLMAGIKVRQFLWLAALAVLAAGLAWNYGLADYQKNRITSFLYPERDPLGGAYQSRQAIIAIGSGGFMGKGLGQGTQTRLGFLPEYQTDFIFAAIPEEWGLSGVALLLAGWFFIFRRLYKSILDSPDNFSRLFTAGLTIIIAVHFIINVGANMGFLPITGLPLAFVSYGGSNLVSLCVGLGILQAVRARVYHRSSGAEEGWG